ncbi:hypothetical protein DFQ14_112148 [Halopolyspora algeriensis]|uniref:Uncharacterized protein n=1 Tax=Halopolyspora algeriensis TaxID=1500506 RepID=A0A368VG53_9ACTN|nr:hypothetical protein DFQ14_112148 [Halopolyspora algeriensis]TQM46253.1 hypothetical protein FHU43_3923 [Halopolyspora algeriensis]
MIRRDADVVVFFAAALGNAVPVVENVCGEGSHGVRHVSGLPAR